MTYWAYHLIFTLPVLALLLYLNRRKLRIAHLGCFMVVAVIVVAFTTPWDNYAVYLDVWGFGEGVSLGYPFRSLAETTPLLGHIPIEEYAYFMIEAAMACLVALFFLPVPERRS